MHFNKNLIEKYDTVICCHVLEHFKKEMNEKIMINILKLTKKRLIIVVPYERWNKQINHLQRFSEQKLLNLGLKFFDKKKLQQIKIDMEDYMLIIDKEWKMPEKQLFEIKLGSICNNNCLVCSILDKKSSKNKSLAEIKKELEQIRKQYSELAISGGEPTIRKDMIEIIKHAKELGFYHIILRTNGRMFSYANFCKDVTKIGVDCFQIDLFGHTPELHDSVTGVSGSFDQTIQGIKNLKELNQNVTVNVIITKQNYEQLPKITEFLINLNVDLILLQYINPEGIANKNNLVRMSPILMNEINKSLDLKFKKYNWNGYVFVKELSIKPNMNEIRKKKTLEEIKLIKNKFQKNL